jgi:hypothetical protein
MAGVLTLCPLRLRNMQAINVSPLGPCFEFTALDKVHSQLPSAASCSSDLARLQKSSLGPMSIKRFLSMVLNIALNVLERHVD